MGQEAQAKAVTVPRSDPYLLAAEWPCISRPDYTGALVRALGGADISRLTGSLRPSLRPLTCYQAPVLRCRQSRARFVTESCPSPQSRTTIL